jgi:hypothetical protein
MKFGTPIKEPKQPKDYWHRSNSKFKKRFSKLDINLNVDINLKDKTKSKKIAFMNFLKKA